MVDLPKFKINRVILDRSKLEVLIVTSKHNLSRTAEGEPWMSLKILQFLSCHIYRFIICYGRQAIFPRIDDIQKRNRGCRLILTDLNLQFLTFTVLPDTVLIISQHLPCFLLHMLLALPRWPLFFTDTVRTSVPSLQVVKKI